MFTSITKVTFFTAAVVLALAGVGEVQSLNVGVQKPLPFEFLTGKQTHCCRLTTSHCGSVCVDVMPKPENSYICELGFDMCQQDARKDYLGYNRYITAQNEIGSVFAGEMLTHRDCSKCCGMYR